ncbi:chloride channel protein [Acidiphilium sp. AL]|uniref:chloride channel protein n=1 Tax=Acidiphilium sp. AL TaxID=2871704 RepID=UPI0021CB6BD1|nr:chloride channel protein [Acidiphilium sp. AL]MCU4159741.1 chloride channel protein [Acidiphilium sp. AL]
MKPSTRPASGIADLGDFTTDKRLFPLSALALLAGTFGVAAGWILLRLIALINNISYYGIWSTRVMQPGGVPHHGHPALWTILIPVAGAVIIGIMARYGSEKIRGHGIPEAIEAIMLGNARLDLKVAILKPISSAISIGTGGPFGAEGPIIMTGGAAASLLAQCFSLTDAERKTLLVAGACAGMTAVFGTPVAAILLAVELLLFEWKPRSVLPVAIACITAAIERRYVLTPAPLFPYVGNVIIDPLHALGWVGLGLIAGLGSALLTMMVYAAEDGFLKLPIHWMWWPVLGGVVVGIGGIFDPLALGVGYPDIAKLLAGGLVGAAAIRLVLVKSVIWSVALGSGTSGGVLAPLLIMGGALGAVLAPFMPHAAPGFWAVVGMAAMMGGTMRSPLTSTLFAVELTGNHLILLPVITASMASMGVTVLLMKRSILTEKIARRGHHLTREYSVDPLAIARAGEIMATPVETLGSDMSIGDAIEYFLAPEPRHRAYPVTDENGDLAGLVSRADILAWIGNEADRAIPLGAALAHRRVVTAWEGEMAITVASRMITEDTPRIPVVDHEGRLQGIISRADLLRVHHRVVAAETKRERYFRRRAAIIAETSPEFASGEGAKMRQVE